MDYSLILSLPCAFVGSWKVREVLREVAVAVDGYKVAALSVYNAVLTMYLSGGSACPSHHAHTGCYYYKLPIDVERVCSKRGIR